EHSIDIERLGHTSEEMFTHRFAGKVAFYYAIGGFTHRYRVGCCQSFNARTSVGNLAKCQIFISPCSTHLPNHDHSSVYTNTYCQSDAFVLFQTDIQGSYRLDDSQPSSYSSLCVIFMRVGIPKVHQQSIAKKLRNVSIKTLDDFRTSSLIRTDHIPILFRVE